MATTGAYDEFVFTTGDELWDRIHQAHRRFAALLSVTPAKTVIPGSVWTAGDVAGHLLMVLRDYTRRDFDDSAGLASDRDGLAEMNAAKLAGLDRTSVPEVLDQAWQGLADLEAKFPRSLDLHHRFPFHSDQKIDGAAALGNLIGEFLVHGHDVAKARGKVWKIGSRNAALALNMAMQVGPGFVRPDAPGDLRLEIRTPQTNPWLLDLAGGVASSRRAHRGDRPDVRIYGRTEPLLLNLYGRMGIATATAHGITLAGGRRPWRLARLPRSFVSP